MRHGGVGGPVERLSAMYKKNDLEAELRWVPGACRLVPREGPCWSLPPSWWEEGEGMRFGLGARGVTK
jgi:hypothetical protein